MRASVLRRPRWAARRCRRADRTRCACRPGSRPGSSTCRSACRLELLAALPVALQRPTCSFSPRRVLLFGLRWQRCRTTRVRRASGASCGSLLLEHLSDGDFAERRAAVNSQAFGPLVCEVALQVDVDAGGDAHGDERAERGQCHVFVRVPLVALGAEVGLAEIAADDEHGTPFDQLEQRRRRHRQVERQEVTPEAADVGDAQEHFADRVGEQEAVAEVHHAVEIVALPAERFVQRVAGQLPPRLVVRHFRIGVVRADRVQAEKHEQRGVRDPGERKHAVGDDQHRDADEQQRVLQPPVGAVVRMEGERHPQCRQQYGQRSEIHPARQIAAPAPDPGGESMSYAAREASLSGDVYCRHGGGMNYVEVAIPFFILAMLVEFVYGKLAKRQTYRLADTVNSLQLGTLSRLMDVLRLGFSAVVVGALISWLGIAQWSMDYAWQFAVVFVAYDFCYYLKHRFGHEFRISSASIIRM